MKTIKRIVGVFLFALTIALVAPSVMSVNENIRIVEAATKINKKKVTLIKGQTTTLKITGTQKKIKWSSSKKSVASVSSKGKVTAKKNGTATITAKVGSKKYTCDVSVQVPKISKTKLTMYVGDSETLSISGTDQKISWKSSNKKIATVDKSGNLVGIKSGKVEISAKVLNKKYSCIVTVKAKQCKLNAIKLELQVDQLGFLELQNAKGTVAWKSSDNSVVKVSNGILLAIKPGNAKITATYQKKKYVCAVTVKKIFSEEDAVNKLIRTKTEQEDAVTFKVKNNYMHGMSIWLNVLFYDNNGYVIDKVSDYCECLHVGDETIFVIWKPRDYYDENEKVLDYAYYKCEWEVSDASYYLKNDSISYNYNYGNDNIMLNLKNNSENEVYSEIVLVMYRDGRIAAKESLGRYFKPYQSIYEEINLPFDSEYNDILKPDKIEIYIS